MPAAILQRVVAAMAGGTQPLAVVDPDPGNISNTRAGPSNCFSGVTYFTDGTMKSCDNAGTYNVTEQNWLVSGNASDCYLEWEEDAGSPDTMTSPPTATPPRLQMSAGNIVFETRTNVGPETVLVDVNINIFDAATGGNVLASYQITLDAEET